MVREAYGRAVEVAGNSSALPEPYQPTPQNHPNLSVISVIESEQDFLKKMEPAFQNHLQTQSKQFSGGEIATSQLMEIPALDKLIRQVSIDWRLRCRP